jgi:hypothetical protein
MGGMIPGRGFPDPGSPTRYNACDGRGARTPRLPLSLALCRARRPPARGTDARRLIDAAARRGLRRGAARRGEPRRRARARWGGRRGATWRRCCGAASWRSSGVDLFLPPEHLAEPGARGPGRRGRWWRRSELAAELAGPGGRGGGGVDDPSRATGGPPGWIEATSPRRRPGERGCAWPTTPGRPSSRTDEIGPIGVGIDPAAAILAGGDPAAAASRAGAGAGLGAAGRRDRVGARVPGRRAARRARLRRGGRDRRASAGGSRSTCGAPGAGSERAPRGAGAPRPGGSDGAPGGGTRVVIHDGQRRATTTRCWACRAQASADEIKAAYRKLARNAPPGREQGRPTPPSGSGSCSAPTRR